MFKVLFKNGFTIEKQYLDKLVIGTGMIEVHGSSNDICKDKRDSFTWASSSYDLIERKDVKSITWENEDGR